MRTPLNAIIGFAEVIEHGVFGQHRKYSEDARDIGAAGRELHGKIGDILDFADLEARKEDIPCVQRHRRDRERPAQSDRRVISPKAQARHQALTITMPPVAAEARANTLGLRRIMTNLLTQCARLFAAPRHERAPAGDEHGRRRDDRRARSGQRVAPHELARAGEPFTTFERPGATTGSGMGLAVATMLAKRMGGALRLASVQGEGTTAELRLAKK